MQIYSEEGIKDGSLRKPQRHSVCAQCTLLGHWINFLQRYCEGITEILYSMLQKSFYAPSLEPVQACLSRIYLDKLPSARGGQLGRGWFFTRTDPAARKHP